MSNSRGSVQATRPPPTDTQAEERSYEISPNLVMLSDQRRLEAEAVRTIRTHIAARHLNDGHRGLALCSATAGSGCTFTAVNLAVALSQTGVSTLLIDADLRSGDVESFIRPIPAATGLKQCLETGGEPHGYIHPNILPHLSVLFAGGTAENPQELLGSDAFKQLIEGCLRDFDFTIVDCAPAKAYADARRIGSLVGYGIIVARRDVTLISDMTALSAQMREDGVSVVGTVLSEL